MRMINYTKAEEKILAQAAKCAKFAAAYGASTETIAKILGVQLKGDRKMKKIVKKKSVEKKSVEKYNVRGGQMEHYVGADKIHGYNHYCAFCGGYALHRFKAQRGTQVVYLCTKHMVQFFHLKPNRMAPKVKEKLIPLTECMPREYILTRTMNTPIKFFGKKVVCHDAGLVMGIRYFFSLYVADTCPDGEGEGFYLSMTGVLPKASYTFKDGQTASRRKTVGMNYVDACTIVNMDFYIREGLNWFLMPERCHPGNIPMLRTLLEAEATTFIEMVNAKKDEVLAELAATENG